MHSSLTAVNESTVSGLGRLARFFGFSEVMGRLYGTLLMHPEALSLDDLVLASFVSGPSSTTLPMQVFSSARMGVSPKINALATILIVTVSAVGVIGWYFMERAERKRQREMQLAAKQ